MRFLHKHIASDRNMASKSVDRNMLSKSMIFRLTVILIYIFYWGYYTHIEAATPAQILQTCSQKLTSARSVRGEFTITMNGKRMSGQLLSKGNKFTIQLPGLATWYDGASMWSYSSANKETTLWKPTKSELAEANPLLYLSQAADYTVTEGKAVSGDLKTLILTPRKRNTGIKRVVVTISTSTNLPKSIKIEANSAATLVNIKSLRLNTTIPDTSFKYDKNKYKGVQVIDLR